MEEILHYLGWKKLVNNGINYQPQLVSRILFHQQYQVSPDTKTGHLTVFLAFKAISWGMVGLMMLLFGKSKSSISRTSTTATWPKQYPTWCHMEKLLDSWLTKLYEFSFIWSQDVSCLIQTGQCGFQTASTNMSTSPCLARELCFNVKVSNILQFINSIKIPTSISVLDFSISAISHRKILQHFRNIHSIMTTCWATREVAVSPCLSMVVETHPFRLDIV